ncbi:unnamed protein product [Calicophoron daubneyi]|uniref:RBR-type E3 ubiquitin transferase n=1 Tax=Calicophoron daubneyi TaxID=300641 RepID=A0AAV2TC63_CALDB
MSGPSALDLQTTELELLYSTFDKNDPDVSMQFDAVRRQGLIRVNSRLPEGQQIHFHGSDTKLLPRNTKKLANNGRDEYLLNYLPPVTISFNFQNGYPGTPSNPVPLEFSLQSVWLPQSILARLVSGLNKLADSNPGELILWHFIEFLRNDAVYYTLDCTDRSASTLHLDIEAFYSRYGASAPLTAQQCTEILLMNNDDRLDTEFSVNTWECPVCYESKLGSSCFRFPKCKHVICSRCVRDYFVGVIRDGMMLQPLACLECGEEAGAAEARAVLSSEEFTLYDELQLKRGLSLMQDIAECPRPGCGARVILDDRTLGRCPVCELSFCPQCLFTYHGTAPCLTAEERGRYKLRQEEEWASTKYFYDNCKSCPKCTVPCDKTEGCDKVVCHLCHMVFCWVCLKKLDELENPYDHFRKGACSGKL